MRGDIHASSRLGRLPLRMDTRPHEVSEDQSSRSPVAQSMARQLPHNGFEHITPAWRQSDTLSAVELSAGGARQA